MKMILPNFSSFWRELEVILTGFSSTSTVFNQYRDCNHEIDLPAAASIRINNLRGYMEKAMGIREPCYTFAKFNSAGGYRVYHLDRRRSVTV